MGVRSAIVEKGIVTMIVNLDAAAPEGTTSVPCPAGNGVQVGDRYDGEAFAPPVPLIEYAAAARYKREIGGITVGGIAIATDDRAKQMIMGARIAADADPGFSTPWVGADGTVYPIDAATMIAISNAVLAHVSSCFAIFATVKSAIDAVTITTTAEIDAAFAA